MVHGELEICQLIRKNMLLQAMQRVSFIGILLVQVQGERVTVGVKNFFPGDSKVTFIELLCE